MPPASATQSIDCASASEEAPIETTRSVRSRKIAFPPRALALFLSTKVMSALVPLAQRFRRRSRGTEAAHAVDWIPAVPPSWGPRPVRPVTLRRHLSMALPLSESRLGSADQHFLRI